MSKTSKELRNCKLFIFVFLLVFVVMFDFAILVVDVFAGVLLVLPLAKT